MKNFLFVIVNYGAVDEALKLSAEILSEMKSELVVIYDNTDDSDIAKINNEKSAIYAEEYGENFRYHSDKSNLGYGTAINRARAIYGKGTKYLCFANPDVVYVQGFPWAASSIIEKSSTVKLVSPLVQLGDLFHCGSIVKRRFPFVEHSVRKYKELPRNDSSLLYVDDIQGCFCCIEIQAFDQVDGFDECFFLYGEESDLNLRLAKLGYHCVITEDFILKHEGSGVVEQQPPEWVYKVKKTGMYMFLFKNYGLAGKVTVLISVCRALMKGKFYLAVKAAIDARMKLKKGSTRG